MSRWPPHRLRKKHFCYLILFSVSLTDIQRTATSRHPYGTQISFFWIKSKVRHRVQLVGFTLVAAGRSVYWCAISHLASLFHCSLIVIQMSSMFNWGQSCLHSLLALLKPQTAINLTTVKILEDQNIVFNETFHSEGSVLACDLLSQTITFYSMMFYTTTRP